MSANRPAIIQILFLLAFMLSAGQIYGQNSSMDSPTARIFRSLTPLQLDTIDYIPYALDYNLMVAASKNNTAEIKRLIGKGANVNAVTTQGASPLVLAVSYDAMEAVKTILTFHPLVDVITNNYETPLLIAVKNHNFNIAEELIRAGADVNFRDRNGVTPLHHASLDGFTDIADLLLYYDANTELKSPEGTTPLLAAVWSGNTDMVDLLLQRGANIEEKDYLGFTPFLMAAYIGDTLLMNILYKAGADIYAVNTLHNNALSLTIIYGNKEAAEFLFKLGYRWTNPGNDAVDPYSIVAKYQRPEFLKILKDNNIPGQIVYRINQIAVNVSSRFFIHDIYTGISLSFKEPYINAGFILGCDTKLWYTRVLIKNTETRYYQYMDKGSVAYAGVFKDFVLSNNPDRFNFSFSTSLLAGYSFGNKLKGTEIGTDNTLKVIPSVSFKFTKTNLSFNGGLEYINSEFYHVGPVWLRLGVSYNYFFDNIRTKIKPIKWD